MRKNKIYVGIITFICSILFSLSVCIADSVSDVVVCLQINNPIMKVNGIATEIDVGRGTKPVIFNDRTLVPIRTIIETFGGTVEWENNEQAVLLSMDDTDIKLVINSYTAYLNGFACNIDISPIILNERTMMPMRFVAESFNLGVAWDDKTQTVSIIRNSFDEQDYQYLQSVLSNYSGSPYTIINNNIPLFKDYEIISGTFEYYSKLDSFGRCDVAMASIAEELKPITERENISSIIPTGWKNNKYDVIPGKYLYNRCHLIAYQLTGENANKRNLITGTRYMNIEGMLPFENMVNDYIEQTGKGVMYRVSPVFTANNLVADGVLMEAYSIEDKGQGISFCVYCYNIQPNIIIDYTAGDNKYFDY